MEPLAALCLLVRLGIPGATVGAPATPRAMTLEARRLMDSGDAPAALALMMSARAALEAAQPPDRELADALAGQLHNAGVQLNNAGDPARAMQAFGEILHLDSALKGVRDQPFRDRVRSAVLQLGRFLAASGRGESAREACRLLASRPPGDAEALTVLGTVLLSLHDDAGAAAGFEQAAAIDPGRAEAAAGAGQAWLAQGKRRAAEAEIPEAARLVEMAVRWLERAVEIEPRRTERLTALSSALVSLASLQERLGDIAASGETRDRAEAGFTAAVELDPAAPGPRMDRALFLFAEERYRQAADEFGRVVDRLESLLKDQSASREAPAWRGALETARENRTAAWHNLAVEALNSARFDEAALLLSRVCEAGKRWEPSCRSLRATLQRRRETFEIAVAAHQRELAQDPDRATALLALGDLYAQVGDYEAARRHYERLRSSGGMLPGLEDRLAAVLDPGPLPEIARAVMVPRGRVKVTFYDAAIESELATAVKAAWLRVTTALGEGSLGGDLTVVVFPTRRVFRERGGARVGGLVRGYYRRGRISLYQTPSHSAVEWVSALTHEMAHHAVERLSGGRAPRWLTEGLARYVEGDTAVVDRVRLRQRLASGELPALADLDTVLLRSWNDPELYLDGRDMALRAVEELVRARGGEAGVREGLRRLASAPGEDSAAIGKALGITLADLDAAWRRKDLASPE